MRSSILKNPNEKELIQAIYTNRSEFFRDAWKYLNATTIEDKSCVYYYTGYKSPILNGILNTKIGIEKHDEIAEKAIAFFDERQSSFVWFIGALNSPRNFHLFLEEKGFVIETNPGMALDLKKLQKKESRKENLSIIKGQTMEHVKYATEVGFSVYGFEKEPLERYLKGHLKKDYRSFYIALLENEPVGISEVFYNNGVAGIFFVGTIESARGQGIGTAITLAPLFEAKKLGFEWAILLSTKIAYNMYKKIGFKHLCDACRGYWMRD
jgi:GNAT superfamily N-acetyltransferase